jgi:hypothetical protein
MYWKYAPYLFLVFGALFLYDGITNVINGKDAIISFAFTGVAIFMFFFRRNYYKKFENKGKQ